MTLEEKLEKLKSILAEAGRMVVAFSGGVDSSVLLAVAHSIPEAEVLAITADSPSMNRDELREALSFIKERGIAHRVVHSVEFGQEDFLKNDPERCYICKSIRFKAVREIARAWQTEVVMEGSNVDDLADFRPGKKALAELNIRSPLREAGLKKAEIRELARRLGLMVAQKPSQACLVTRIAYGERIEEASLEMIERAEQAVRKLVRGPFRVRKQGGLARIEVTAEEMPQILQAREALSMELKTLGFTYVSLDLDGFRSGSANEALDSEEIQPWMSNG